jgi:hypothetical protein
MVLPIGNNTRVACTTAGELATTTPVDPFDAQNNIIELPMSGMTEQ